MTQASNSGDYLLEKLNGKGGTESEYTDEVFGQVISTSPLKVLVDSKMTLTSEFLELTKLVQELKINVELPVNTAPTKDDDGEDIPGTDSGQKATGEVTIWRGIQAGDSVRMLRVHSGQKFILLERVGGDD